MKGPIVDFPRVTVVFSRDRVSKLREPCTKSTVLYSEKIT